MHSRPVRYSSGCCATAATADFGPTWWECWSGFVLQLRCVGRCRLAFMHRGFTDVLCASVCERSSDSSRFRPATHSSHFLRSRCSLRIIPAAGLTSRRNVQTHRSAGAPRARWARPELGRDPDVTPDQHCEEWRGLLRDRAFRRGMSMAFQSLLLLQSDGSLPEPGVRRGARRSLGDGSARRQRRWCFLAVLRRRRRRPVARRQVRRAQATVPRPVNGTGHTGPSEFCATSI